MQIQIIAFLAVIGLNAVFGQASHAADTTIQSAGKLVITVKGETRNETMKELMKLCQNTQDEIPGSLCFEGRERAVLCKISSDNDVPWKLATFEVPCDSRKAATLILER